MKDTTSEAPINPTPEKKIKGIFEAQRQEFDRGRTLTFRARKEALKGLLSGLRKHERPLLDALRSDLNKSEFEAYSNEIGIVLSEIKHALGNLRKWMKPRRLIPELHLQPGIARVIREPYGVSLIIGPWNYPVQLLLSPLVGALAGGNTAILKPSEVSVASSRALTNLIEDTFPPELVGVVNGGKEESELLLDLNVDKIFFTGSVPVGRLVMQAAARRLTPLTLELGGKSPAVVAADALMPVTARRIAWGKFNNAGQTCVAPDYVLVHERRFGDLVEELKKAVAEFYGDAPEDSPSYGRIINGHHFERLQGLVHGEGQTGAQADAPLLMGGQFERESRYISPSVYGPVSDDHPLMQDEIFGPLLPIQTYHDEEEAIARLRGRPKPLALYVFTRDRSTEDAFINRVPFGGGAVNTTMVHVASSRLPFGGIGPSGLGYYHGRWSFEAFTHMKSILKQSLRPDLGLAYPHKPLPLSLVRRLLG